MIFTDKQKATMLAALRAWQDPDNVDVYTVLEQDPNDENRFIGLTNDGIEDLCRAIKSDTPKR